jgi:MFS transporter, DHA1 family, tetracycline resistance protein
MIPDKTGIPAPAAPAHGWLARGRAAVPLEPWFTPFTLVNGAGVGLSPILLPVVAARYGVGHVGLVMGAFNLGALAAPLAGDLADRFGAYRLLATVFTAVMAVALWLFPWASPDVQVLLGLAEGAGFAAALTVGNLLIVERRPKAQWNVRLASLETTLGVGQAGALFLAAWLSGLGARDALGIGAIVPAAAIPLALSRLHRTHRGFRTLAGWPALLRGGFGWMLGAWIPAYAGTAIIFALYPVLFLHAFGISATTSALAFAVIVFVSLPLYVLAGRTCQRRGPARTIARALTSRVILLSALAAFAAVGHIPAILPLACFAGIMFAWSFLSIATPELTAQLMPNAQGDAQGLLNGSSGAAGLVGSVVGGVAASHWGYPAALAIGAGSVAVGLAVFSATTMRGRGAQASS